MKFLFVQYFQCAQHASGPCPQGRLQCHDGRGDGHWDGVEGSAAGQLHQRPRPPPCSPAAGEPFSIVPDPDKVADLCPHIHQPWGPPLVMGVTVGKVTLQEPVMSKDPWKKDLGCAPQQPLLPMLVIYLIQSQILCRILVVSH